MEAIECYIFPIQWKHVILKFYFERNEKTQFLYTILSF